MSKKMKNRKSSARSRSGGKQGLLGPRERSTMKFVYFGSLNPAASAIDTDTYRANGPYDPDYAAGGGQPYGYDQLAAFFERYTVLGARATLTCWSESSTSTPTNSTVIFALLSASATAPTTLLDSIGQPLCVWAPLGSVYGKEVARVTSHFSAAQMFATPNPLGTGSLGGLYNGVPDLQAFFHIGYGATAAGVDPAAISYCIEIEYDTVWSGRQQVTSS